MNFFCQVKYSEHIVRYSKTNSYKHQVYQNLLYQTGNEWIPQILFEEWEFLITNSWLISKVRFAYDKIVESSGTAISISKHTFEVVVRRTLKKAEGDLSPNDKLKATAKWIAVGGSALADFVLPVPGAILNTASGIFLLCDP